jgi:hypothetical protein
VGSLDVYGKIPHTLGVGVETRVDFHHNDAV